MSNIQMANVAAEKAQFSIKEATDSLKVEAQKLDQDRKQLKEDKDRWEGEKKMLKKKSAFGQNVTLNVGGIIYQVSRMTLTESIPRSHMLATMFSGLHPPDEREESGVFFIDRNGKIFEHILEYLRSGSPAIFKFKLEAEPQRSIILYQLHEEARYYQIPDLINDIRILVGIENLANLKQLLVPHANFTPRTENSGSGYNSTWKLDYGGYSRKEITTTANYQVGYVYQRVKTTLGFHLSQRAFNDNSYFKMSDLSGVTFKQCRFGRNMSFTGSVLFGVKFEDCAGLVENKVRFSRKQIMEADMTKDLVDALRIAECVDDEPVEIGTD